MRKALRFILIPVFLGIIGYCGWKLYEQYREYHIAESTYETLEEYVDISGETSPVVIHVDDKAVEKASITWPEVDFEGLEQVNSDVVAWLYGEGGEINFPVVQGENNRYYLTHLFEGTYNRSGSLFLDCDNRGDFTDRNSIIYGHHMKSGGMFASLENYREEGHVDQQPLMLLITPEHKYTIRIFAGYVTSVSSPSWQLDFATGEEWRTWVERICAASCFDSGIQPGMTDKVITLSTCNYDYQNARFVLYGILERQE